jgi:hypothetical protein
MYSDNLIPELPNTAHSCSSGDGSATAWLTSERPATLYLSQKYLFCSEHEYMVSRNKIDTAAVRFCVILQFISVKFWHSTSLTLLERNCTVLLVLRRRFWKGRKKAGAAACRFTPAPSRIKLCDEGNTYQTRQATGEEMCRRRGGHQRVHRGLAEVRMRYHHRHAARIVNHTGLQTEVFLSSLEDKGTRYLRNVGRH